MAFDAFSLARSDMVTEVEPVSKKYILDPSRELE
jgi:hypothetical protein